MESFSFVLDSAKVRKKPGGGIIVPAKVARYGTQSYPEHGAIDFRPKEEVFSEETKNSLKGAAVVVSHEAQMLTPDRWKNYAVGFVGDNIKEESIWLKADLHIEDADAIKDVLSRKLTDCSAGYSTERENINGVFDGIRYDRVQRNIVVNHIALLPPGTARAGKEARIELDQKRKNSMAKKVVVLDGISFEYEGDLSLAGAIERLQEKNEKLKTENAAFDSKVAELNQEISDLKTEIEHTSSPEHIAKLVAERQQVVDAAFAIKGEDYDCKGRDRKEIIFDCIGEEGKDLDESVAFGVFLEKAKNATKSKASSQALEAFTGDSKPKEEKDNTLELAFAHSFGSKE